MRVQSTVIGPSVLGSGRTRLSATVSYEGNLSGSEEYWFDLPEDAAGSVETVGDVWLMALLPLAVTLGEPLSLSVPVDDLLLDNARQLVKIWHSWYPHLTQVDLRCESFIPEGEPPSSRAGAFFSGGVDSFYTLLRPRGGLHPSRRMEIDDLVIVWGFDIPLSNPEAFLRMEKRFRKLAGELGKRMVSVATNIRETQWKRTNWGELGHGCALAAGIHAMRGHLGRVFVPTTGGYRDLHPWGSHSLTDPLLSSSHTVFVPDGASSRRVDKLALLSESPLAMGDLRVCWQSGSDQNCEHCPKCVRTMLALELLGVLDASPSFRAREVTAKRARKLFCKWPWDYRELLDLLDLARKGERRDMVDALEQAMEGSRRRTRLLALLDRARSVGPFRLPVEMFETALFRGWIR